MPFLTRSLSINTTLLRIVFFLLLIPLNSVSAKERGHSTNLQGTFIQLLEDHGKWGDETWAELFTHLKQLRLSQLVIQWAVYDETAFFHSSNYKTLPNPPLHTILKLADDAGMKVFIGLYHDPEYWERIRRHPTLVEVYLKRLLLHSGSIADQLAPLAQKHPSFQGWYINQEVDDINWKEPEARKILFEYLRDLSHYLHEITPGKKVLLSGFSNAHSDPQAFEEFWKTLLKTASVDVVLFQDGIGTKKLRLDYLPLYLSSMQKAVEANSRDLQVVVEIFRQVNGAPFDNQPFKAEPAPLERINRQVKLAAIYSASGIIAFSIPEYMTPFGGEKAERLFNSYLMGLF